MKSVYDNLLADLHLQADEVPLIAGEVVNADHGGVCAGMNEVIAMLPQVIKNCAIVSSKGVELRSRPSSLRCCRLPGAGTPLCGTGTPPDGH